MADAQEQQVASLHHGLHKALRLGRRPVLISGACLWYAHARLVAPRLTPPPQSTAGGRSASKASFAHQDDEAASSGRRIGELKGDVHRVSVTAPVEQLVRVEVSAALHRPAVAAMELLARTVLLRIHDDGAARHPAASKPAPHHPREPRRDGAVAKHPAKGLAIWLF